MKSRFSFSLVFALLVLSIMGLPIYSHSLDISVSEPSPLSFLGIQGYIIEDAYSDGNLNTRLIRLEIRNTGSAPIYNLRIRLDSFPENVTSNNAVLSFSDLEPGVVGISENTIQLTVDMTRQSDTTLRLIWAVECEVDGQTVIDETSVLENL